MLDDLDLENIRFIVRQELAAKAVAPQPTVGTDPGTGRVLLPIREYTEYEVSNLIGAFPGINESQAAQMLKHRDVANSVEYINDVLAKFGESDVMRLPHTVFQTMSAHAQFAGPFPYGIADIPSVDGTEG